MQYKLRDWLFSRQRHWGEPFSILHAEDGTLQPRFRAPQPHPKESRNESRTPAQAGHADAAIERLLHKAIRKVQHDIERFAFNTAIAQMIVFVNEAQKADGLTRSQMERFLRVLTPFAPHICEELWHRLGHADGDLIVQAV